MSDSHIPLTPDDEQHAAVHLPREHTNRYPLYTVTAVMAGMTLLLVLRGVLPGVSGLALLNIAVAGGVVTYLVLLATHARLPLGLLSVLAAELGLLYSLPMHRVYYTFWKTLFDPIALLWWMGLVGIIGFLLGYVLNVKRYPVPVLAINFLGFFVIVGMLYVFAGPYR